MLPHSPSFAWLTSLCLFLHLPATLTHTLSFFFSFLLFHSFFFLAPVMESFLAKYDPTLPGCLCVELVSCGKEERGLMFSY